MTLDTPIPITPTSAPRPLVPEDRLGFGTVFSDHMFLLDYTDGRGWHNPRIVPYGPLALDPAAAVLHYAEEIFDGFKAFRAADGAIRLFRADAHCRRLSEGAARLCMPAVDPAMVRAAVNALVRVDRRWVPSAPGTSLYIRPALIATEPFLGVRPATRYLFFVILCPVGAYYAEGLAPTKIWVEPQLVRAPRGGLGAVKAGANYAASLLAGHQAKDRGYTQVLWLDAAEHKYLEEVGTSNLFVLLGDELATPALSGSILAGITRDSVIKLAREWGWKVAERAITIDEIVAAHDAGTLKEVFASGTAAVISPVGELGVGDRRLRVSGGGIGALTQRLYDEITGIQSGARLDRHGWMSPVE